MQAAETACSMLVSFWQYLLTRVPRTQSKVVRRRAKLRRQRNQPETTDLEIPFFSASVAARRLTTRWHWGAIPPAVVNTSGLKSACSTFRFARHTHASWSSQLNDINLCCSV